MWRLLPLRLGVALFTFTIGVTSTTLWENLRPYAPKVLVKAESLISIPAEKKQFYYMTMSASGTNGVYDSCSSMMESSYGGSFSVTRIYYDSPKRAHRELEKRLKRAKDIIERKPLLDENGRQVGEQAI